ncbi:hypothetical protein ACFVZT_40615 [Streptomyces sp. NPDC058321]|uniref:hypothetical protein n=1 Tax=Streptomyces sp. NPDC058321 TaxID=3346445 RepID=UPI0036ECB48B
MSRIQGQGPSASLDWPAQALGNVGAEFEVLGPPEFAAHVQGWGARFIRATRAPDPDSGPVSPHAEVSRRPQTGRL